MPLALKESLQLPTGSFEALIFDCDGTLADTMPLHHQAWCFALKKNGANFDFTWELFLSRAGMSLENTVVELNQQHAQSLDVAQVALDQRSYYGSHLRDVAPIAPVVDLARRMQGRYPMAVASGSQRAHVERTLEAISVRALFSVVVTAEEVAQGKPAPDAFLLAASLLGASPEACLVFEDAELGLEAARRAGMQAVRVPVGRPAA